MGILQKILDFISHVCDFFKKDDKPIFQKNTHIVIRPNGTWVLKTETKQPKVIKQPTPTQNTSYYYKNVDWFSTEEAGEILAPPDFFPHKSELSVKLNECLEHNVINSCQHTKTKNGTYVLRIELPCNDESLNAYSQFKLFAKAMESQYNFTTISTERILSKISNDHFYVIIFEYDPRKSIF